MKTTFSPRSQNGLKTGYVCVIMALCLAVASLMSTPAHAVEIIPQSNRIVEVEFGAGTLVRLDRPAASVFVANTDIADVQVKSPRLVYLLGAKPGQTSLFAVDSRDRVIANLGVKVTHNVGALREAVSEMLPEADIEFSVVNDTLVMRGSASSAAQAEEVRRVAARFSPDDGTLVNQMTIEEPVQVQLRVRIAEIQRDLDKQIGVNWTSLGFSSGFLGIGLETLNPFQNNGLVNNVLLDTTVGSVNIDGVLDALEDEGLVSILAEPNLTALTGETASFLAGGEFPVLIPQSENRVIAEYKPFGVSLDFTPTILGGNRINLNVRPEVSQISESNSVQISGFAIPSLNTRRAETTVELASGQSFAIAGLIQNNTEHNISKFPGLGDLPIIGALFRSDRFQREETELVMIVTPYIVKPINNVNQAMLPTDGYAPPHDMERLIRGGTHRRNPQVGEGSRVDAAGNTIIGPVGFELQ